MGDRKFGGLSNLSRLMEIKLNRHVVGTVGENVSGNVTALWV